MLANAPNPPACTAYWAPSSVLCNDTNSILLRMMVLINNRRVVPRASALVENSCHCQIGGQSLLVSTHQMTLQHITVSNACFVNLIILSRTLTELSVQVISILVQVSGLIVLVHTHVLIICISLLHICCVQLCLAPLMLDLCSALQCTLQVLCMQASA